MSVSSRLGQRAFSVSAACNRTSSMFVDAHEIAYPVLGKQPKLATMEQAFGQVKSGDNIFVHGIAATPTPLLKGLCNHVKANNLSGIKLHHLHLEGDTPWLAPDVNGKIRSNSLFTGANLRKAVNEGLADFNSCFLYEVPLLFRRKAIRLNVALIQVSPPDANGYCSLGTSVDTARAAVTNADYIIALSNKNMPRTFGDGLIHSSHIDVMVEDNTHELHERHVAPVTEQATKIGQIIADNLVDNGATLQMGIGGVPDAALSALHSHKDLGIHTEMFSDGILPLVENNVITNSKKAIHPGKLVVSFVYGSTKLYNFLHDNPLVEFGDVQWVNDPAIVRKNPKVTAINSAVEIDLTGQVVSDSVGKRFLSGFGGQVDFIRGASIGNDGLGKPIIALPAITAKGISKIVPTIKDGSGVVTSRAHVHYVVTENGIAQLWGKNMRQRAYELIKIADPSVQQSLEKAAFDRLKVMPSAD